MKNQWHFVNTIHILGGDDGIDADIAKKSYLRFNFFC